MPRLCERPGCSALADVAYGFDPELLIVWLDGFHAAQGVRSGVLCRRHADAMVVPLGWMLDDRREPVPRLFKSAETEVPPARAPRRRPRVRVADDTEQLRLDAALVAAIAAIADDEAAPAATAAEGAEPADAWDRLPTAPGTEDEVDGEVETDIEAQADAAATAEVDADGTLTAGGAEAIVAHPVEHEPVDEEQVDEERVDEEPAAAWRPVFDPSDDLSGLLRARGRLLSRAFGGDAAER